MFDIAFAQLTVLTDHDVAHGEVRVTRTYTHLVAVVEKSCVRSSVDVSIL